eukprot:m.90172 g.90172  ORF g.90172 m.90172 type:complete len:115 (-) comp13256_c0_seq1:2937-3281(-)
MSRALEEYMTTLILTLPHTDTFNCHSDMFKNFITFNHKQSNCVFCFTSVEQKESWYRRLARNPRLAMHKDDFQQTYLQQCARPNKDHSYLGDIIEDPMSSEVSTESPSSCREHQ